MLALLLNLGFAGGTAASSSDITSTKGETRETRKHRIPAQRRHMRAK